MRSSLTLTAFAFAAMLTTPTTIAQPTLDAPSEIVSFEIDLSLSEDQLYAEVRDQARTHCKSEQGSRIFDQTIRRKCRTDLIAQVMSQIGALDFANLKETGDIESRSDS